MSDFIVLKCENCGARLEVSKEKETFYCEFCGYKHILINNAKGSSVDESYAACPLCKRNDKTQKVTSLTKFDEYNLLKNELIKAQNLWPPFVEPDLSISKPKMNILFYSIAIITGLVSLAFLLFIFEPNNDFLELFLALFLIFISATPLYFSVKKIISNNKKHREKISLMKSISDEKKALRKQRKQEFENKREIIIDNLYYCSRDDIVFEKSLRDYTKINKLSNYIKELAFEQIGFDSLKD